MSKTSLFFVSNEKICEIKLPVLFCNLKAAPVRNLYSREELGVFQIEKLRQNAQNNFKSTDEIENYKKWLTGHFSKMLLDEKRDNPKEYILLLEGKTDELKTLKALLMEYQESYNSNVHHVKDFVFATQIMRMFYLLDLPDEAVNFFKDNDLKNMFEQMQTYKVMLSLLFENKLYSEVFEMYKEIRTRLDLYELFPDITVNCLAFGACYKLNTPEHYQYAQELWKRTKHMKPLTRSRYFLAALAINQNQPEVALNLVPENNLFVTVRFIQLIAFTKCGNFDRACKLVRQAIDSFKSNPTKSKPNFGNQMIEDLRVSLQKFGTESQMTEFNKLHEELKSLDLINNDTLDERLCATFPPMLPKNVFLKMKNKTAKVN